jgi:hypothetical protein
MIKQNFCSQNLTFNPIFLCLYSNKIIIFVTSIKTKMFNSITYLKKQLNHFVQVVFVFNVPALIFVSNQNNRFTLRR